MNNRASIPILTNLLRVYQMYFHTKFEGNPCSGLRGVENEFEYLFNEDR